jgi:proline dehydrogenase
MAGLFSKTLRPAILAASRSHGLQHTAERLTVTRKVVNRFVPGETQDGVLDSTAALRDSGRLVSIDYLGEQVTDAAGADATVTAYLDLLDALGRRPDASRSRAPAGGIAEVVRAGTGAQSRRREDRPRARPPHL